RNALNPDLAAIAGHINDGVIRLWNVETGESLGKIEWTEHSGFGLLAFSPNGRQLLSINSYIAENRPGGYDLWETTIDTWDTTAHQHVWGHKRFYRVVRAAYSPDSRWIVTADINHRIATWDATLGAQREIWHAADYVQPIQFSPDSRRIYIAAGTGGYPRQSNRVSVWNIETGEKLKEFGDSTIGLGNVSISPDERQALLWYSGGYVVLWDIMENRRFAFVTDYVVPRWGSISPDGRCLISRGGSAITIWDFRSESLLEIIFPVKYFFVALRWGRAAKFLP
ncbi:MAG: hypothetical protein OXT74_05385, partial [Candidatus Poribacteria bacterium]|nr:hypothetical protein [Candidatus Poribacteria bacterium]